MKTKYLLLFIFIISTKLIIATSSTPPSIIWASTPVKPNETVVLQVGNISEETEVQLARLNDSHPLTANFNKDIEIRNWTTVNILQRSDHSLKFIIPPDWAMGVFACRIVDKKQYSNLVFLNSPKVLWFQGNNGISASPGGWVRINGNCLKLEDENTKKHTPIVQLQDDKGKTVELELFSGCPYDIKALIPDDLEEGNYQLLINNGFGGNQTWIQGGHIEISTVKDWPQDIFNVKTLGLSECLKRAIENKGGIIYFPRGQYEMEGKIEIPERTILRGERTDLSHIYWTDQKEVPEELIAGQSIAFEDISLYCQNMYKNFIKVEKGELRMERVRIRSNHMFRLGRTENESNFRGRELNGKQNDVDATLLLKDLSFFMITDCDILAGSTGIKLWSSSYGYINNTRVQYGRNGIGCEAINKVIIENSVFEGIDLAATGNYFASYFGNSSEYLLVKNCRFANAYGLDQELLSFDGAGGAYFGTIESAHGQKIILASDPVFKRYADNATNWENTGFFILDGKGAGQFRRVVNHRGREWELNEPWLIEPDKNSIISIVPFRGYTLFIDNTFEDGGPVQLFGTSIENIFSGNKGIRMNGFLIFGNATLGWGWQPSWYNQFLDNEIKEGVSYGNQRAKFIVQGVVYKENDPSKYSGPLSRCGIIRNNIIQGMGNIQINGGSSDILIEKNIVKNSDSGIVITEKPNSIFIRKNSFENVQEKYSGAGLNNSIIIRE